MVKKVAQYMADVLEDSRDKVQENLLANGGTVTPAGNIKLEIRNAIISVPLAATSVFLITFIHIFDAVAPRKPKTTQSRRRPQD